MKIKNILIAALSILLVSCAGVPSYRHTSNFGMKLSQGKSVYVLPADVEIYSVDSSNKRERLDNYEYFMEDIIKDEATSKLNSINFKAKFLSKRDIHQAKISKYLPQLMSDYQVKHSSLYDPKIRTWDKESAENLGIIKISGLDEFTKNHPSDFYAIIHYKAYCNTTGSVALNVMTTILLSSSVNSSAQSPNEDYYLTLSFIDGKDHNIIWTNSVNVKDFSNFSGLFAPKDFVKYANDHKKHIRNMLDALLLPLKSSK